ncbi:MAG TPA: NirD/YgiW/YdeI family stress tolerance protein [Paenalcaligenes sp.]|nr:NirD/YgiW/YdeI family stress tolerance protein [Paenalcaligenes sp.]
MKHTTLKSLSASVVIGVASAAFVLPAHAADEALPVATSVGQILENVQDDQPVSLKGTLTKLDNDDEKYSFSDGTGEIQVDIDEDVFPPASFSPDMQVEITGEVDKGIIGRTEIDVKSVNVATE